MDGLWVVGEFEQDQYMGKQKVLTWKAHYVAGWDHALGEYRAFVVDSNGRGSVFRGELNDDSFAIISLEEVDVSGQSFRLRMVWDMSEPANSRWLNEGSLDGKNWFLIEAYTIEPM